MEIPTLLIMASISVDDLIQALDAISEGPVRVKRCITQLSYLDLVDSGVLPNLIALTPAIASKRYPPWIYHLQKSGYTNVFSDFGLFVEEIIYAAICSVPVPYVKIWTEISQIPVPDEIKSDNNFLGGIVTWTRSIFRDPKIEHNKPLVYKSIEGHPDLLCHSRWILEVKTTGNFSKMAHQTYLQILAYCALARKSGQTCNFIGILLPLQRQIVWFDVTSWQENRYLDILLRESEWVMADLEINDPRFHIDDYEPIILAPNIIGSIGRLLQSDILGTHIRKDMVFDPAFRQLNIPVQIFLSNPQAKSFISSQEIEQMKSNITPSTQLYVHAPYIINLANDETWPAERLRHELLACRQLGGKGVVVHVGCYKQNDKHVALQRMESSIKQVLEVASDECPLILETPVGEGTELCVTVEQLQSFYASFGGTPKLKICIDTAHIWVRVMIRNIMFVLGWIDTPVVSHWYILMIPNDHEVHVLIDILHPDWVTLDTNDCGESTNFVEKIISQW